MALFKIESLLKICCLFGAAIVFTYCAKEEAPITVSDVNTRSIMLYNYTGHLVRRSGVRCGEGIEVEFVLTSPEDRQEYIVESDRIRPGSVIAMKGQTISISAYEIKDNNRSFLTQRSMTYDPPSDAARDVLPSVILCPKDQIEFYDFN